MMVPKWLRPTPDRTAADAEETAEWTAVAVPATPAKGGQGAPESASDADSLLRVSVSDPVTPWDTEPTPETSRPGMAAARPEPSMPDSPHAAQLRGLSRVVAAEVGVYSGVGLMAATAVLGAISGWPDWSQRTRVAVVAASGLGLLAAAAWLREAGGPELAEVRRRATSGLLSTAIAVMVGPIWGAVMTSSSAPVWGAPLIAFGALLLTWGADRLAKTPYSQTAVLAWAALIVLGVPPDWRVWCLPALVGLGMVWSVLGWRYLTARRSAVVAGSLLAMGACVVAANGVWSWPARGLLLAAGVGSLWRFLRGGRNAWLAVGVASWAALAATAAGAVLGPLLALAIGGAVTVAVSLVALRTSLRE